MSIILIALWFVIGFLSVAWAFYKYEDKSLSVASLIMSLGLSMFGFLALITVVFTYCANNGIFEKKIIDELWLAGPAISKGMEEEIKLSLEKGIPVKCHNPNLEPELKRIIGAFK